VAVVDLLVLLVLGALWGASFLFLRVAVPVLGPVSLIEARVLVAGLALLAVGLALRRLPDVRRDAGRFLTLGALSRMSRVPWNFGGGPLIVRPR